MLQRTAMTIQSRGLNGAILSGPDECLFADCPKLIGAKVAYGRDQEIYGEAEEAECVYKVVSGAARTYKLLSDGRRQIDAFHLPGDLFGFISGPTHRLTAEAILDTVLMVFKRRALEYFAKSNTEVARQLWQLTANNLEHAEEHMLLLGRKTATERVAAFLLEMDGRKQRVGAISLPMPRRDIADYLGLTLETVSRIISQLQADGMVERSTARRITVQKHAKLRLLGSDDACLESAVDDTQVPGKHVAIVRDALVKRVRIDQSPISELPSPAAILRANGSKKWIPVLAEDRVEDDNLELDDDPEESPQPSPPLADQPQPAGTRREVFGLDEGDVVLTFPGNLSSTSYKDLEAYLTLFLRKAKRRTERL